MLALAVLAAWRIASRVKVDGLELPTENELLKLLDIDDSVESKKKVLYSVALQTLSGLNTLGSVR